MALTLVLAAVFVLLLVVVFRTLDAWPLFKGSGAIERLAFSAAFAALCVFSLRPRATDPTAAPAAHPWLDVVLLPHSALVITLLSLPAVLLLAWLWNKAGRRRKLPASKDDFDLR